MHPIEKYRNTMLRYNVKRESVKLLLCFYLVALFGLNLDYIEDYMRRGKSTLNPVCRKKVVSQYDCLMY